MITEITKSASGTYKYGLTERSVLRDASNNIYTCIQSHIYKSTDSGATWDIKNSGSSPIPPDKLASIAIDHTNVIHLVWNTNTALRYTKFFPSTDLYSASAETITTETVGSDECISIDSNNIPHVIFTDVVTNMGKTVSTLYYTNKIGGTWKTKYEIEGITAVVSVTYPNLIIDANNKPQISYYREPAINDNSFRVGIGNANNAASFTLNTIGVNNFVDKSNTLIIDSNKDTWVGHVSESMLVLSKHPSGSGWTNWTSSKPPLTVSPSTVYSINEYNKYIYCVGTISASTFAQYPHYYYYSGSTWSTGSILYNNNTNNDCITRWSYYGNTGSVGNTVIDIIISISDPAPTTASYINLVFSTGSAVLPSVTTINVTEIGMWQAVINGNVTSDGNATITSRGILIDTASNFATLKTCSVAGTTGQYYYAGTGSSLFNYPLPGKMIYARAFAVNSVGVAYGSTVSSSFQPLRNASINHTTFAVM